MRPLRPGSPQALVAEALDPLLAPARAAAEAAAAALATRAAGGSAAGGGGRAALLQAVFRHSGNTTWSPASLAQPESTCKAPSDEACDAACREWVLRRAVSVHLDVPWEPGLGLEGGRVAEAVEAAARAVAASGA
jgi:hypothetical protein